MGVCSSQPAPPAQKSAGPQAAAAAKTDQASANNAAAASNTAANTASSASADQEADETAMQACPADVYMLSGCKDEQTSADVGDVMSFGVPGPGGAGGACTNALLAHCYKPEECDVTWIKLMLSMVKYLEEHGYTQRPMLSTSRRTDLNSKFSVVGEQTGTKRALLIGINYINHDKGQLSGCINDVASMKRYIATQGFEAGNMTFLTDGDHAEIPARKQPTKQNIEDAIDTFVKQAAAGDSLFFHYSGHGGQKRDKGGDEKDGKDETLIPDDYKENGVITDDDLFARLCAKLPAGVRLVCVMDCCHSGTILDLPFAFAATPEGLAEAVDNGGCTQPNASFAATLQKMLGHFGPALATQIPAIGTLGKKFGFSF